MQKSIIYYIAAALLNAGLNWFLFSYVSPNLLLVLIFTIIVLIILLYFDQTDVKDKIMKSILYIVISFSFFVVFLWYSFPTTVRF